MVADSGGNSNRRYQYPAASRESLGRDGREAVNADRSSIAEQVYHAAAEISKDVATIAEVDTGDLVIERARHIMDLAAKIMTGPDGYSGGGTQPPLNDTELMLLRAALQELYDYPPATDGSKPSGDELTLPSLHHIEDTIKHWVEHDFQAEFEAIKNAVTSLGNLKTKIGDIDTAIDRIDSTVDNEIRSIFNEVLAGAFHTFETALRPFLQAVVQAYDQYPPDNCSLRVGYVQVQWDKLPSAAKLLAALDKDQLDLVEFLDDLEPDSVGIDAEVDVPLVGESTLGLEIQCQWDLPTFKQVWADVQKDLPV